MKNCKVTELQYGDFSLDFHQKTGKKRIPIVGQMELTFHCNLKCVHCYVVEDRTKEELTFQEITNILDQIHEEGCLWLSFTGGEPLMREDFLDIYHYAKRKGFLITILTNGTLITQKISDYLAKESPFSIDITLNGIAEETYENISQVPGSFRRVMDGIKLILERNLPLKIKTKVTRLNYQELDRIKEFVEGLGVKFQPNGMLYPKINSSLEPLGYRLSTQEIISLDRFYLDGADCEEKSEKKIPPSDSLFRCAAGISSFYISPYGELIFCTFMRKPNFDLRKGSFKEGFYSLYPEIRSREYQTNSKCKDCRIFYLCSQCPALAKLENDDMERPVEYFCQLAHKWVEQPKELKLAIGGIGISIKWEGSRILSWPHPFYEKFISNMKPQITFKVYCGSLPQHSSQLLFDGKNEGYWKLYRNDSKYVIETFDTLTHKTNKVCFMEPDFQSGDVYVDFQADLLHEPERIRSEVPVWSFPLLMQPIGQLLLVNVLAKADGIMMHGLGINDRGEGIAFVGGSGAGKSTLAGFWGGQERADILSDEHIIIRKKNGQFWLYGTPWPGMAMTASSESVPLKRIFFIEHAAENKILGQGTIGDLFPLLFLPFWDKIRMRSIMQFCEDLIKKMDCKKLGFVKDGSVVEFAKKGVM